MTLIRLSHEATDPQEVGGKAAALARLEAMGFAPPAFLAIRPEAFTPGADAPQAAAGLKAALDKALPALGPGPYAVRSSGRAEDGAEHSHAGQFDSLLNIEAPDVIAAAKQVWLSGFSDRVQSYRDHTNAAAAEAPGIVVQQMITPRASGVAFSADPMSGQRGRVVISAIAGLGDQLVSGTVDGEDWVICASGEVLAPDTAHVLSIEDACQIADLATRVETAFGAPQDIEWAIDAAGLHILQARPITTPLLPAPHPDRTLTIFDNSNVVESYPGLVSPLTYSFATCVYARVYRAFVRLLGVSEAESRAHTAVFDNLLGRVDGRVYYNLVNWYRALAMLPGFSLNRGFMETMMGVSEPMPAEITQAVAPEPLHGAARWREYARLARVALGLIWQAIRLPHTKRGFYRRLNDALDSELDLASAPATALAAEYRRIERLLLDQWDAPLVNDFLCMIAFGASRRLLERWLGPAGLQLHNDVMIGQGDIVSAQPAQRIAAMGRMARAAGLSQALQSGKSDPLDAAPELRAAFDDYLTMFGDRCTEELKLESIPLTEDPSSLIRAIAASAERPEPRPQTAHEPDWATMFKGRPLRRVLARVSVGWAKARVSDRENLRFERTRIFGYARRVFRAIGREFAARGLLEAPRDIFFLTVPEVLGAIEGGGLSPDLQSIATRRKIEQDASAQRPDPPERIEIRGPAIAPIWADAAPPPDLDRQKTGTGCSAGVVEAKARVIRDPRRESLRPGDILVARHTDPGWIAVFANASAIVVERGSLLSHSAIVARELGIPCVVGLKGATQWITDGETLRVNGATGLVERIDDPE